MNEDINGDGQKDSIKIDYVKLEGTHDIYMLWQNADEITAENIDPYVENLKDVDSSWNIDEMYDIEKVQFGKDEKLLAYQYVWGEGGHSDKVGIMVSEVLFQKEKKSFAAEESWLEEDIKPDVILDSEND